MIDLIIDTCVWINLCGSVRTWPLLKALNDFIEHEKVRLVVPYLVEQETKRLLPESPSRLLKSGQSHIREIKGLLKFIEGDDYPKIKDKLDHLSELLKSTPPKISKVSDLALRLISNGFILRPTNTANTKAIERGIKKLAPFNKGAKNSMADSIILELLLEHSARLRKVRDNRKIVFLTTNKSDFSARNDERNPHEDFVDEFTRLNIEYRVDVVPLFERLIDNLDTAEMRQKRSSEIEESDLKDWWPLPMEAIMPLSKECPICGGNMIGSYLRSREGLTWVLNCNRCSHRIDTGEYWEGY